jgi:protein transport protein SEC23
MKSLVNLTNGLMILSDSFATEVFKQSFLRVFSKDAQGSLNMAFNATLEVQTTKELKVCGLIGPAVSAEKKGPSVGETEIGVSGTCAWKFCGISPKTTVAVYFEVANQVCCALLICSATSCSGWKQRTDSVRYCVSAF